MKKNWKENGWLLSSLLAVIIILLSLIVWFWSDKCSLLISGIVGKDTTGNFIWSDLNLYGIIASVLAGSSLFYTFYAYKSQAETERNTRNVPIKDQKEKFRDLTRHEYRNLVAVLSTAVKYFDKSNSADGILISYPSESHILKLQADPEDFVLDIAPEMAATVSKMRLQLRNYNIEINVACKHLAKQSINDGAIVSDYDNLIYKPLFLVKKACEMEAELCGKKTADLVKRSIGIIIAEHLKKLKDSLPNLISWLENDSHCDSLFETLEIGNGLSMESADRTNALQRSFSFLFKYVLNKDSGTLLWKIDTNTGNKGNSDKEEYKDIDEITPNLPKLKDIEPKYFKWTDTYKDALESIKAGKELDFVQFFPLMLKLDIAAELSKIGMVKF